jgi:hypothetical protein
MAQFFARILYSIHPGCHPGLGPTSLSGNSCSWAAQGGGSWVRIELRTGNQQSPGENRIWDWKSTVQHGNHWATPHPHWAMPHPHWATLSYGVPPTELRHIPTELRRTPRTYVHPFIDSFVWYLHLYKNSCLFFIYPHDSLQICREQTAVSFCFDLLPLPSLPPPAPHPSQPISFFDPGIIYV